MDDTRSAHVARILEATGSVGGAIDAATRRAARLKRVQDAWLRQISPRALAAARDQLTRRRPPG